MTVASSARQGGARRREPGADPVLVLDVGNSKTAYAVYRGTALEREGQFVSRPRNAEAALRLLASRVAPGGRDATGWSTVLASVVPAATRTWVSALRRLSGRLPMILGVDAVPGFTVRVPDPSSVGADRLANALGALAVHGAPAVVVDFGTATTFDAVDGQGRFLGGAIAPGLATGARCLTRSAARLRAVALRVPRRALGRTTEEALLSGLVLGHAGLVDALVARIAGELSGRPRIIATGGLAHLVAPLCAEVQVVDERLTRRGLLEAYRRRQKGA